MSLRLQAEIERIAARMAEIDAALSVVLESMEEMRQEVERLKARKKPGPKPKHGKTD